jgi:phage anti-repressor protein
MEKLDIISLIETNPIIKLNSDYNNKLLNKIKNEFTDDEQKLFLTSFYCYLNYHPKNDFVIDLDNVWKWLGFSQKYNAERILEKHFIINNDYKNLAPQEGKASSKNEKWGGHNKKTVIMNIRTFKLFCLLSETQKAKQIHNYFIKLEELLHEVLEEESLQLKLQLQEKDKILLETKQTAEEEKNQLKKEKLKEIEKAIISQFPVNTECIYFGTIDDTNEQHETLMKFGHTNDLSVRVQYHHKHYNNFNLVNAFKVQNKVEIENLIKTDPKIKKYIRTIQVNGKNKTEIIAYNNSNFTIDKLTKYIKDIIHMKMYSIENFHKLTNRNEELEKENVLLNEKIIKLEKELSSKNIQFINLNDEFDKYKEKYNFELKKEESVYQNVLLPEDETTQKFNDFVANSCIIRNDVEEKSVNLEGRFRLWNKIKPTKEMFHSLKNYLDTRFKPRRIEGQHGYVGIKLKPIEYKKMSEQSDVETFIFQMCQFSDCGKILNSSLLREYQKWKMMVDKSLSENDMKEIKDYLNNCPYALKATVWTDEGNNEGYYGLTLKEKYQNVKSNYISTTGKKVYKKHKETNELLCMWETIAKAALNEGISTAKMSRCVKNKTIIDDYYYTDLK